MAARYIMQGALRKFLFGLTDDEDDTEQNVIAVATLLDSQRRQGLHQPIPNEVKERQKVHKNRVDADARMMHQYFNFRCTYGPKKFKGRFALPRPLFLRILEQVCDYDHDFRQKTDACGIPVHSPYMKMVAVMKHFSKGIVPDSLDDYTQMAACTIYFYAKKFMDAIIWIYTCAWRACPMDQEGSHVGYKSIPTVVLQAVASYDRWIWHSYFGLGGQNNDCNVLRATGLFDRELNGVEPTCHYQINGRNYNTGYYVRDGAYPMYGCLVQAHKPASNNAKSLFNQYQEAKRKDIERAFGGLKGKFGIILKPCCYYKKLDMKSIMMGCLIMHNMCVEMEYRNEVWRMISGQEPQPPIQGNIRLPPQVLYNPARWAELREELTTHIWLRHGHGLGDGDILNLVMDYALPEVHEGTTDVDTDEDQYDPQGDGAFYENGE
ncbi:uncharacterized protein LOC113355136 [Papaver somniferum]|uniref:uncharacterized protein LOC113355136 n=1 Tax=Papaver somniferum TaxID=3469 RepID=UPI000E6F6409|nr:uncharacterized protein LOC113355136 [Papaver somniferum]